MLTSTGDAARAVLTGLFRDPFDVAQAITDLVGEGFSQDQIDAIGVLCGRAPDLTDWLFAMGLEQQDTIFCNDCFADGATLLVVRTERGTRARIALKAVRRHRRTVRHWLEPLRMPVTLPCSNGKGGGRERKSSKSWTENCGSTCGMEVHPHWQRSHVIHRSHSGMST